MDEKNNSYEGNIDSDLDLELESLDLPEVNFNSEDSTDLELDIESEEDTAVYDDLTRSDNEEDVSLSDEELDNILEFEPTDNVLEENNENYTNENYDVPDSEVLELEEDNLQFNEQTNTEKNVIEKDSDVEDVQEREIILPEDLDKDFENIEVEYEEYDLSNKLEDGVAISDEEFDGILDEEETVTSLKSEETYNGERYPIEPIEIDQADDLEQSVELKDSLDENSLQTQKNDEIEALDLNISDDSQEESIQLSEDELNNILKEDVDLDTQQSENLKEELRINDDELAKEIITEEDEEVNLPPLSQVEIQDDDSISLTQEELENIISNGDVKEISEELIEEIENDVSREVEDYYNENETEEMSPSVLEEDVEDTEAISLTDEELNEIIDEFDDRTTVGEQKKELKKNREQLADDIEKETGIKKEELKKIIAYLDTLFEQLPEETIKEFSKSEYFNLYKKVIETLGIYPPDNN